MHTEAQNTEKQNSRCLSGAARSENRPSEPESAHRPRFFDASMLRFIGVGLVNTAVGSAIMFGLYNLAGCSYWLSSAVNYTLTSILSYFLNKHFTFRRHGGGLAQPLRFAVNIAVCYLLAYSAAQPAVNCLLAGLGEKLRGNLSLLAGMCIFTALNYLGQRFFVFRQKHS